MIPGVIQQQRRHDATTPIPTGNGISRDMANYFFSVDGAGISFTELQTDIADFSGNGFAESVAGGAGTGNAVAKYGNIITDTVDRQLWFRVFAPTGAIVGSQSGDVISNYTEITIQNDSSWHWIRVGDFLANENEICVITGTEGVFVDRYYLQELASAYVPVGGDGNGGDGEGPDRRTDIESTSGGNPSLETLTVNRYENNNIEAIWGFPPNPQPSWRYDVFVNGVLVASNQSDGSEFLPDPAPAGSTVVVAVSVIDTTTGVYSLPFVATGIMEQGAALVGALDSWDNVYP